MEGTQAGKIRICSPRKVLLRSMLKAVSILILLVLALKIYLATPLAAAQLSRFLTSRVHQPVRVTGMHTSGCTLHLTGLSLGNPSGFPAGNLVSADSIAIAPQWLEILFGRRSFRLIELDGVRVDLLKNSNEAWNFSPLQHVLASGKPGSAETFIGQLAVRGGAFQVNGQGLKGIALKIFNISTKGPGNSRIALDFEDSARNRYRVEGKGHPGNDPAFDLTLTAPELSLDRLAGALKLKNAPALEGGSGQLRVNAELREGLLRVTGGLDFSRLSVPIAEGSSTLAGKLSVTANYNLNMDEARLEALALSINDLMNVQASGTVADLKGERRFRLDLDIDKFDLGSLVLFLPEPERRRTVLGGTLDAKSIRLSGSGARGLTGASGSLLLRSGSLTRDRRLLVSGLDGSLSLSGTEKVFLARGKFSQSRNDDKALVERIEAPIEISLSSRMKPLVIVVPALSAKIMGVQMAGRFGFKAADAKPYTLSLRTPATATATINPLLKQLGLHFRTGTTSLALEAAGHGAQDFSATATARLANWQVSKGKQAYAVKQGVIDSRLSMKSGKVAASGKARLTGLAVDGRSGDARCSYQLADGKVTLSDAAFRNDDTTVTIARLGARIPVKESGAGAVRYPVSLEITGAYIMQSQVALQALSGTLNGSYVSEAGSSWLEGKAELAAGGTSWQGKPLGAPAALLVFSRTGGKGKISGSLLGGKLSGEVAFNPLAPEKGGTFQLGIKGASLATVADFLPRHEGVTLADGLLDASLDGGYSGRAGLRCRFAASGSSVTLTGNAGKTLLAKGGFGLSAAVSGQNVSISNAILSVGEGVMLKAKGEMSNVWSTGRKGSFTLTLPETDVNSLIDPVANILPRYLQEATFSGAVAAEARFDLQGGRKLLNGSLLLKRAGLELTWQKFTAADIKGTFPFSIDFSGGGAARASDALSFNRQNYPELLEQFRRARNAGPALSVGKLRFGPMETGPLTMHVIAGNGITEITAMQCSLYRGNLFGRGYITTGQGLHYRGDLLLNNLSLLQFCDAFPEIRGYISGRLDGIASLSGKGYGREKILGFSELWTRSGSGEKMYVSKEFLQKLAGKKLRGFFFRGNRSYDRAEIKAILQEGVLTFETLDILHTNFAGVRDLSVSVFPASNSISLERLFNTIAQAGASGKTVSSDKGEAPVKTQFKWLE
jgi:hypothetical protein